MKRFVMGAALMASTFLALPASAQVINLAAADAGNPSAIPTPKTLSFDPGTYIVQVVGKAGGGLYDAWGVATPAAGNYNNAYAIDVAGNFINVDPYNGQRFATATDALDAFSGIVTSFTLAAAGNVTFGIPDTWFFDNTGGVSLKVSPANGSPTAVPEPATMGLFGLGAAALLARRRRKKQAVA